MGRHRITAARFRELRAAPDGAEVYALHPGQLDAGRVRLLAAADVPAMFASPAT